MMKTNIEKAFNSQLNAEFYSAYLYLSMASFFDSKNFSGMARWMKIQSHEEMSHGMKFYQYLNERNGKVLLENIDAPPTNWKSPLDIFEKAYNHECHISSLIHELVSLAEKEKDYPSISFLQWFVSEQVEEEATALKIVDTLKMIGDNPSAIYILDKKLGTRTHPAQ